MKVSTPFLSWLLMMTITPVSLAHAAAQTTRGEKAGNGGKIIRCPGALGESKPDDLAPPTLLPDRYEVLDFHRARPEFGIVPLTDIEGADEFAKARALIERLRTMNPTRADLYLEDLARFTSEADFVSDADFPKSDDTNEVAYCTDGEIVQAITQRDPLTSFEKRYLVNQDIWKQLPIFQKALLLTHEIALKETLAAGYDVADGAARMNAFIFARDLPTFTPAQIAELVLATGLLYFPVRTDRETPLRHVGTVRRIREIQRNQIDASLVIPFASLDFFRIDASAAQKVGHFPILGTLKVFDDGDRSDQVESAIAATIRAKGYLSFSFLAGDSIGPRAVNFDALDDSMETSH